MQVPETKYQGVSCGLELCAALRVIDVPIRAGVHELKGIDGAWKLFAVR